MSISIEKFFNIFLEELKTNKNFHYYYKFLEKRRFEYRKAYFIQRLDYILRNSGSINNRIWDCGCGFGTSAIFLALNGYSVYGTTTEHYFKEIESRIKFWSHYGNLDRINFEYEYLFEQNIKEQEFDRIIVQDTLHHLEPIDQALNILRKALKNSGKLIIIEQNGSNIFQFIKDYKLRGNKRIIEIYDEHLKKNVLIGNENTRSLDQWVEVISRSGFHIDKDSYQFIRVLPPFSFNETNMYEKIEKERVLWKKNKFLRDFFYFGINFIAQKE